MRERQFLENLTIVPYQMSSPHNLWLRSSNVPGQSTGQATQTRKKKGKMVLGGTILEPSYLSTPCNLQIALSAASGLKFLKGTRVPETKKHKGGRTLPFSCPPGKRIKHMGKNIDNGRADCHSRSHTDPLPVHKKQFCGNCNASLHAILQDEIEKLRAYYANVDAFELPIAAASDSDSD